MSDDPSALVRVLVERLNEAVPDGFSFAVSDGRSTIEPPRGSPVVDVIGDVAGPPEAALRRVDQDLHSSTGEPWITGRSLAGNIGSIWAGIDPDPDEAASVWIEGLCWRILDAAQDLIARETHQPWPGGAEGSMPAAFAETVDGRLVLGYGDPESPALALRPIESDELP